MADQSTRFHRAPQPTKNNWSNSVPIPSPALFWPNPLAAPISAQHCIEEGFIGLQVGGDAAHVIEVFEGIEQAQAPA